MTLKAPALIILIITLTALLTACQPSDTPQPPQGTNNARELPLDRVTQVTVFPEPVNAGAPKTPVFPKPEPAEAPKLTDIPQPQLTITPIPTSHPPRPDQPTDQPPTGQPPAQRTSATREAQRPAASGPIQPINTGNPQGFLKSLTPEERNCIPPEAPVSQVLKPLTHRNPATLTEQDQQLLKCLHDETVLTILVSHATQQENPLSGSSSACIREALQHISTREALMADVHGAIETPSVHQAIAAHLVLGHCLTQEEWNRADTELQEDPTGRATILCLVEGLGGPVATTRRSSQEGDAFIQALLEIGPDCTDETPAPEVPDQEDTVCEREDREASRCR